MKVYLNGQILPREQAFISPFDHGFLYGYGLFDTLRSYGGRFFRLEAHLERIYRSAKLLKINLSPLKELEKAFYDLIEANGLKDARVRVSISCGVGEALPKPFPEKPTIFIAAYPYNPPTPEEYEMGWRVIIAHTRTNSLSLLAGVKSLNYLNFVLARREAQERGSQEGLLLNERGFVVEGSASNIFLVKGGLLITPDKDSGALMGITRSVVIEIAHKLNIPVEERGVGLNELFGAEEVFLTNTLIEVMPVCRVDGVVIGLGRCGEITRKIRQEYQEIVRKETGVIIKYNFQKDGRREVG